MIDPFDPDEFLVICNNLYKNDPISPYTGRIVEADLIICKEWISNNPGAAQTDAIGKYVEKMETFCNVEKIDRFGNGRKNN